jgi:hypothetical protein
VVTLQRVTLSIVSEPNWKQLSRNGQNRTIDGGQQNKRRQNVLFRTVQVVQTSYTFLMVDWRAEKIAHKSEACPVCTKMMRLAANIYTCEQCGHFWHNPLLQTLIERDDRSNLKFCDCAYCQKLRAAVPALDSI